MPTHFPTDYKGAKARMKADRAKYEPMGEPRNPGKTTASSVPPSQHGEAEFAAPASKQGYSLAKAGRETGVEANPKPSMKAPAKPLDH